MNHTATSSVTNGLPRGAVLGAGSMVLTALLLVVGFRIAGVSPARPEPSAIVASYEVRFEDRQDGAVLIYSEPADRLAHTLEPGTNGFVRGVLRGLARERRAEHVGPTAPFKLTRWADGRLSLDDPSTGRHVDLEVFGPTNAGAFAAIFDAIAPAADPLPAPPKETL
jgi:putative photosynthetic complex assembly protein